MIGGNSSESMVGDWFRAVAGEGPYPWAIWRRLTFLGGADESILAKPDWTVMRSMFPGVPCSVVRDQVREGFRAAWLEASRRSLQWAEPSEAPELASVAEWEGNRAFLKLCRLSDATSGQVVQLWYVLALNYAPQVIYFANEGNLAQVMDETKQAVSGRAVKLMDTLGLQMPAMRGKVVREKYAARAKRVWARRREREENGGLCHAL